MLIHVVNKGEMLWQIAHYYQTDINTLVEINGLINPNILLENQALLIPTPGVTYTVRYGDTLSNIAHRFGVPLQELLLTNRILNPNLIYPGVVLTIPQRLKPGIEVNAYTYVYGINDISRLGYTMDYLTYLTPFSYRIQEDGDLLSINDRLAVQYVISNDVIPIMSISNTTFDNRDEEIANIVLNDLSIIEELLDNVVDTMKEKGYIGLNVSFRNVYPRDREALNNFLQLAAIKLHSENFFISSSLPPKFGDGQRGSFHDSHDYEAHGRIVDFIILLTYEWGEIGGPPPQNLFSVDDVRRVLDYAVTVIPREKVFMGYEIYARDFTIPYSKNAKSINVQEAMNIAYRHGSKIEYDVNRQVPYFYYKDEQGRIHEVWFEDARSAQVKFNLIKEYKLRGISYWSLGYPFIPNWYLLKDNFIIVKDSLML